MMRMLPFVTLLFLLADHCTVAPFLSEENEEVTNDAAERRVVIYKEKYHGGVLVSPHVAPLSKEGNIAFPYDNPFDLRQTKKSYSSEGDEKISELLQESTTSSLPNAKVKVNVLTLLKDFSKEKMSVMAVNTEEGSQKNAEASESSHAKATLDDLPFSIIPWSIERPDSSTNKNMEVSRPLSSFEGRKRFSVTAASSSTLAGKPSVPLRKPIAPRVLTPYIPRKPNVPVDFKPAAPFRKPIAPQKLTPDIPRRPNVLLDFKPAAPFRKPIVPQIPLVVKPAAPFRKPIANAPLVVKPAAPFRKPIAPVTKPAPLRPTTPVISQKPNAPLIVKPAAPFRKPIAPVTKPATKRPTTPVISQKPNAPLVVKPAAPFRKPIAPVTKPAPLRPTTPVISQKPNAPLIVKPAAPFRKPIAPVTKPAAPLVVKPAVPFRKPIAPQILSPTVPRKPTTPFFFKPTVPLRKPISTKTTMFSLNLMTDYYPEETGWKLSQLSPESFLIASRDFGAYGSEETLYEEFYRIDPNGVYQFEIMDSFGDGLEPPAYYSISLDGISILRNSESCSSFTSDSKTFIFYAGNATTNASTPEVCPIGLKYNNCCQGCGAVFTSKLDLQNAMYSLSTACVIDTKNYLGTINCWNIEQISDLSGLFPDYDLKLNTSCWPSPLFLVDHGTIQSSLINSKCIDAGEKQLSRQLFLNDCQGYTSKANQIFVRPNTLRNESRLQLVGTNYCLDVDAFGGPGSAVVLNECSYTESQKWIYNSSQLRAGSNDTLCLEIKDASKYNGAPLQLGICNGGDHQKWQVGESDSSQIVQIDSMSTHFDCVRVDAYDPSGNSFVFLNNYCINFWGNSKEEFFWNNGRNQGFTYIGGTFRLAANTALCLNADAYPTSPDGGRVTMRPCNWQPNQIWDYDPSRQMFHVRYNSDFCLSYEGQDTISENGDTGLWVYPCDVVKDSQKWNWHFLSATLSTEFRSDPGTITSPWNGKCIDAPFRSPGQQLFMYDCHDWDAFGNQLFERPSPTDLRLRLIGTNLCLAVFPSGGPGSQVILFTCEDGDNQKWIYTQYQQLRPRYNTALCLDITLALTNNKAPLQVWNCHGGNNQRWSALTSCSASSDQSEYRGFINRTISGKICQAWSSQTPHQHTRTPENYPQSGLDSNYCRNPDGESGAWCYTTDSTTRWELCNVPYCPQLFLLDHGAIQSSSMSGKCIDSGDKALFKQLTLNDCQGYASDTKQQIFVRPNSKASELRLQLVGTNSCLDAVGFGGPGSAVVLSDCNTADNQKWIYYSNKELRAVYNTTLCLEIKNASKSNGDLLQVGTCNGGDHQKWQVGESKPSQVVHIDSMSTQFDCVRVDARELIKNSFVYLNQNCRNYANQQFNYFEGTFRLAADRSLCLTSDGYSLSPDGGRVTLWPCDGQPNQMWDYDPLPSRQMFRARYNSKFCLSYEGQNTIDEDGLTSLWVYPCDETKENQNWRWHLPLSVLLVDHGTIQSSLINSKCIDAGDKQLSRQLSLNDCQGYTSKANQIFVRPNTLTNESRLQLVGTTYCLDVDAFGGPGSAVVLNECSYTESQKWIYNSSQLRAGSNDTLCLEIKDASKYNGAPLQLGICNGGDHQKWQVGASDSSQIVQIDSMSTHFDCVRVDAYDPSGNSFVFLNNYCINFWGNSKEEFFWNNGRNQGFTYIGGTFRLAANTALCLNADAYPTSPDGGRVTMRPCNWQPNQIWDYDPSRQMFHVRYNSDFCLSYEGQDTISENGDTGLWVYPCDVVKDSQKWNWHFLSATLSTEFRSDPGTITSPWNGKCIDAPFRSPGQQLFMYDCHDWDAFGNQLFERPSPTDLRLRLIGTNLCLAVFPSGGPGSQVILFTCEDGDNQKWIYTQYQQLRPRYNTALCLDITLALTNNKAPLQVWNCHGGNNQRWSALTSCSASSDQSEYRGFINRTISGKICQAWSSQTPHQHTRTPENYPQSGLDSNFCRNPDGESGAWCYTTDSTTRWELCNVPYCPQMFLLDHGTIQSSSISGKCIDSGDKGLHKQLTLNDCQGYNSGANQIFVRPNSKASELRLQLVGTNSCLDAVGFGGPGSAVVLSDCNTADNQKWIYYSNKELRAVYNTTLCLEIKNASKNNGDLLQVGTCNGGDHQKWQVGESKPTQFVQIDSMSFVACSRVDAYDFSQYSLVYLNYCYTMENIHQYFNYNGGTFHLAADTSLCLDADSYPISPDGGRVTLKFCNGQANQMWDYDPMPNHQMFRARYNSKFCLSRENSGDGLWVYPCDVEKKSQKWDWHFPVPRKMMYNECCQGYGAIFTSEEDLQKAVRNYHNRYLTNTTFSHLGPVNCWNVEEITDMSNLFYDVSSFNEVIECWNVSLVTDMSYMFYGASSFNQPIDKWNTSLVTDMAYMFYRASIFNQPLNQMNTNQVTNMYGMFSFASSFNQPLDHWNTSSVTEMSYMFQYASSFNQPLDDWDTGHVTDMSWMFYDASQFNQNLCLWYNKISALVSNVFGMFSETSCTDLNDPDFSTKKSFCQKCINPVIYLETIRTEIENLIITSNFKLIPKFVRLGFHDCVDQCDGCVDLKDPFNNGLNVSINALDRIVQNYTVNQYTGFSRADIWALAANIAANMSQSTLDFQFSWIGRVDCMEGATAGPIRKMPSPNFNTKDVLEYFQEHFGFNERQTVAIMGGHNLGSAHLDISGFNGPWVHQNLNLTNEYYQNLVDPNWIQEENEKTKKWQWNHISSLMMLNSDVALVREFEVDDTGDAPGKASCPFVLESGPTCPFAIQTNTTVHQYSDNKTLWLHDFRDVFTQMLLNGYYAESCKEQEICQLSKSYGSSTFCEKPNLQGRCVVLSSDVYDRSNLEQQGMQNITSIKVTNGYYVIAIALGDVFYSYYDRPVLVDSYYKNINDTGISWLAKYDILIVQPSSTITMCEHSNFKGIRVTLSLGSYDVQDLFDMGLRNDMISSITVPQGYFATVFRDAGFLGQKITFYTDTAYVGDDWNDAIASIKVGINSCSKKTTYMRPSGCETSNLTLTSADDTRNFIEKINKELNNPNNIRANISMSLSPGTYSWPTDAGVWIHRTDVKSSANLTLTCCGPAGSCVFDGKGQTYKQPLFKFDSPVNLTMSALTFQNFNYSGNSDFNGAIIRTTAFTDLSLHHLNVRNVTSQGQGGVFAFETQCIANITSSTFFNNSAGSNGGVIYYFTSSHLMLWGNNFTHNQAKEGGALFSAFGFTRAQCNNFYNNTAINGGGGAVSLNMSIMELSGDDFSSNAARSKEDSSDVYLTSSGLCKQSLNTVPTSVSGVYLDSGSTYVSACDDSDWRISFPGSDALLARAIPPYLGSTCDDKRPYEPPENCTCLNLTSASDTRARVIDLASNGLNNPNSKNPSITINLCNGTYAWPTDAGVLIRRNDTDAKLSLTINCCGDAGSCIFDGKGQTFSQPLFLFDYPILFIMKAVAFQNINYIGEDAAIVTTKAFTVMDFQYLSVTNVSSQGRWGAFAFAAPAIADITGSIFTNNFAGSDGGVISSNGIGLINIIGDVFRNNTARYRGGALYSLRSYIRAECNRFESNKLLSADGEGGAFYLKESSMQCSGDDIDSRLSVFDNGTAVFMNSSGLCKQSSKLAIKLDDKRVNADFKSMFVYQCDGDHWGRTSQKRKKF